MGIGAGLAGQFGIADEVYTNEVQQISGTPSAVFSLIFDGAQTTVGGLATNASSAAVQAALEALPNIGVGGVVCAGGALPAAITITFSGPLVAGRNVPAVTVQTGITGLTVATNTVGTGFGDYVAPTVFPEVVSANPELAMERIESSALRAGNTVQRTDRFAPNRQGASMPVELEVSTKGMGKFYKGIFGKVATITTPSNGVLTRQHQFTFGDGRNISQVLQVGVPTVNGDASNVKPVSHLGAKVTGATFNCDTDGLVMLSLDYDAQDETTAQALAAASFAAGAALFDYSGATVSVGGAATFVRTVEIAIANGLATDRRGLRGSTLKKQQILNAMREITGSLTVEFEGTALYDKFASSTAAGALTPIVVTFTGPVIEVVTGGYSHKLVFTMPNCDVRGSTPQLEGPDLVAVEIPFKAMTDGTLEPLTLDWFTTDTT